MASRPIVSPYRSIKNGDMSGNITSNVTIIQNTSMMSYSYSWSGSSPVGTVTVEVSNDYEQNMDGSVKTAGTWTPLTFDVSGTPASSIAISGNTGSGFIDIDQLGAYAIRTVYNRVSGTGTLQATFVGKVA